MSWQVIQEKLQRNFTQDRLPQGLLFYGKGIINRKDRIIKLLESILGKNSLSRDLVLQIDANQDPDNKVKKKNLIGVDEIRNIAAFTSTTTDQKAKFVLINGCDFLSLNASNALLKLLELENVKNKYLLIAEKPSRLPKTLLSRLTQIRVAEDSQKEILAANPKYDPIMLQYLYEALEGNQEKIAQLMQENYLPIIDIIQRSDYHSILNFFLDKIDLLESLLPVILFQLLLLVKNSPADQGKEIMKIIDSLKLTTYQVKRYNLDFKKALLSVVYKVTKLNIASSEGSEA